MPRHRSSQRRRSATGFVLRATKIPRQPGKDSFQSVTEYCQFTSTPYRTSSIAVPTGAVESSMAGLTTLRRQPGPLTVATGITDFKAKAKDNATGTMECRCATNDARGVPEEQPTTALYKQSTLLPTDKPLMKSKPIHGRLPRSMPVPYLRCFPVNLNVGPFHVGLVLATMGSVREACLAGLVAIIKPGSADVNDEEAAEQEGHAGGAIQEIYICGRIHRAGHPR
ncbi:hypothetical protein F4780DRAFT_616374 [Xylariomycetidae sp. FL0641]|nr:hypothetical protein F4780DRAFT_616374 [Xylariomycetidae sp. FL0641]